MRTGEPPQGTTATSGAWKLPRLYARRTHAAGRSVAPMSARRDSHKLKAEQTTLLTEASATTGRYRPIVPRGDVISRSFSQHSCAENRVADASRPHQVWPSPAGTSCQVQ